MIKGILMRITLALSGFLLLTSQPVVSAYPRDTQEIFRAEDVGKVFEQAAEGSLKVGMGAITIAPPWPIEPSYGKQVPTFEFYGPDIMAKVLILKVGDLEVLLIECDVIGFRAQTAQYIKDRIQQETGINGANIILAATHNHSYARTHREKVREWIAGQVVKAIRTARKDMFNARIGFGMGTLRRRITVNRHRTVGGFVNTHLYVGRIDDSEGNLRAILFNFGSHPNIFTTAWGPDTIGKFGPGWPGYAMKYIELIKNGQMLFSQYEKGREYHDLFTFFALGAAGDQQPSLEFDQIDGIKVPQRKAFVVELARRVMEVSDQIRTEPEVRMVFKSKVIEMPLKEKAWRKEPRTLLQALILNNTAIGVIPGELTAELGARFEEHAGYDNSFLITIANDAIGYITSEAEAYEAITYEAKGSSFGPQRGKIILDEIIGLVNPDYIPRPPLDPKMALGSVAGRVNYDGNRRIVVGLSTDCKGISDLPWFWGRRTEPDSLGNFSFDHIAPGVRYLYVKEVKDDYTGEPKQDLRTLMYAQEVLVSAGGVSTADINVSTHLKENVKFIKIDEGSILTGAGKITGDVIVDGDLQPEDRIMGGAYLESSIYYRWHLEHYLKSPVSRTTVGPSGRFEFEGLLPGRYLLYFWFDKNGNGRIEPGIDVTSGLSKPIVLKE